MLPDIHSLDIGISVPGALISDDKQDFFSMLLGIHTLDIGIVVPYGQSFGE